MKFLSINLSKKHSCLIISLLYLYHINLSAEIVDSVFYYDQKAENLFFEGEAALAVLNYQRALDHYWAQRDPSEEANVNEGLRLIERLAVCLRTTGQCELIHPYLQDQLKHNGGKEIVARITKKIIQCNHQCGKINEPSFENKLLDYFNLERIDTSAHLQFKYMLNGAETDDEEFFNFFYLLEKGYVPALNSFDKELEATARTNKMGWLILSSIIVIIILGFILYSLKKQKELVTKEKIALLKGKEKENDRLSIDLHDILGYKIVELKDLAKKIEANIPSEYNGKLGKGLDELHESMRYIVQSNLTPESLKFGLGPALETLINRVNNLGVVKFELYKHGLETRLDKTKEKHIFYLIQELVNNIIKHSKSLNATIEVTQSKNEISILAEDNGIGYEPDVDTLKTVKARVDFLKGDVVEDSKLDHGATIIINIPIKVKDQMVQV